LVNKSEKSSSGSGRSLELKITKKRNNEKLKRKKLKGKESR